MTSRRLFLNLKKAIIEFIGGIYDPLYQEYKSQILTTMQLTGRIALLFDLFVAGLLIIASIIYNPIAGFIMVWLIVIMAMGIILFLTARAAELLMGPALIIQKLFQFYKAKYTSPR